MKRVFTLAVLCALFSLPACTKNNQEAAAPAEGVEGTTTPATENTVQPTEEMQEKPATTAPAGH